MADYTVHTWADDVGGATPIDAATLNEMETGIGRASIPTKVTALPGSPYDGQEVYYEASSADGVYWHLRYRSASADTEKWEFLGGASLHGEVATTETTTSTTYADLATAGPSVTVPLAGDYEVEWGAALQVNPITGNRGANVAVKRGAAAAADADSFKFASPNAGALTVAGTRCKVLAGLSASDVLKLQYKVGADTLNASDRWIRVRPIKVI